MTTPIKDRRVTSVLRTLYSPSEADYPAQSLGLFRVGVATLGLAQLWLIGDHLLLLYGNLGIMQWVISETVKSPYLPSMGTVATHLQAYGLSGDQCVYLVAVIYAFSLLALLLGWQNRLAAFGAWFCQMTLNNSGFFSVYGIDTILHICLFHCVWMPVGNAYSVDKSLFQRPLAPVWYTQFALALLRLHLCLIYLNTGLAKAVGEQWWNGEAIWRSVMQPQFYQYDWRWLAQVPWLAKLIGWLTLLIETGYALLIWPQRTRPYWVLATVLLHLGIGIFLGLWLFALMMVVLTTAAFGFPYLRHYFQRLTALRFSTRHATPS